MRNFEPPISTAAKSLEKIDTLSRHVFETGRLGLNPPSYRESDPTNNNTEINRQKLLDSTLTREPAIFEKKNYKGVR